MTEHATVSVFAFARLAAGWRMCVITHPRLSDELCPGGHVEPGEEPYFAAVRAVAEETGHQVRLLPAPLPAGYPHQAIPAPWWIVKIPAAADSRTNQQHLHVDHVFVGVVDRPFATSGGEHPARWITAGELEDLVTPRDTRLLGRAIFRQISAAVGPPEPAKSFDEALHAELLRRQDLDQEIRSTPTDQRSEDFPERWQKIDEDNTSWLERVIAERGWPGAGMVGRDGAAAAWLLAQHADRRPDFQRRCLTLLASAVTAGEGEPRHLAMLEDRLAVGRGSPQIFGSQFRADEEGTLAPAPIADLDDVDDRRSAVGLEPLEQYAKRLREHHQS